MQLNSIISYYALLLAAIVRSTKAVEIINKYAIVSVVNPGLFNMAENYYDPISAVIILRSLERKEELSDKEVFELTSLLLSQIYMIEHTMRHPNGFISKLTDWLISRQNRSTLGKFYQLALLVNLKEEKLMSAILYIQPLNEVTKDFYSTWANAHNGDSGIDLVFPETHEFDEQEFGKLIPFGIKAAMKNYPANNLGTAMFQMPTSFFVLPRSSIYKTPVRMANSVGLIDAGYRGELMAPCDIFGQYKITAGTRLFQIVAPNLEPITVQIVESLDDTSRGTGGFGSTGA